MTKQIVLRQHASMIDRRQPLLDTNDCSTRGGVRLAEVAGGTAAECAAVCCCCPCGLVNLLVLAVYKVPAGLCRKALRRNHRRRMMKQGLLTPRKCGCDEIHPEVGPVNAVNGLELGPGYNNNNNESNSSKEVVELEKEMWNKFYSAGFWRSSSQRSEISNQ